jgi:N,N'-diacetyllegionaminate synthase
MNQDLPIGSKKIGYNQPCYIIAEGCDNHLGNLTVAKEMILQSKLAGADAIKFQHHLPDEEMLPDSPTSDNFQEPLYEFLKKYALKLDGHRELMAYAREVGIHYMCTPFSYKAAEEMVGIGLDAIKIGSGEMTDIPSLVKMAQTFRRPMIVSTGMSTYEEIDRTYQALAATNIPLALTYCVSEYPPVYEDMNLRSIRTMIERYPAAVIGHSDHTPDLYTCFAAVTLGAKIIEKHVILDKRQPGPDQSVSIDFRDLASLVDGVRKIEASLGEQKKVHRREKAIRDWAFRSIITTRNLKKGDRVTGEMIWSKRPGTGIPSRFRDQIIGREVLRDVAANVLLAWEDIDGVKLE